MLHVLQDESRKIILIIKQLGRNTFLDFYSIVAPSNSLNTIFKVMFLETVGAFKGIRKAVLQTELLTLTSKALSM